jgi:hypothetical protein
MAFGFWTNIGDTKLRSDGVVETQLGDSFAVRTDGTLVTKISDTMSIRSDGTVETKIGNTTFGSDGSFYVDLFNK